MHKSMGDAFDLSQLSDGLREQAPGFWVTRDQKTKVSYPEAHHQILLEEQSSSFWYEHRKRCLGMVFKIFPCSQLLDIGGSNGLLTKHLSKEISVVLLEPHARGIQNAIKLGIRPVVHADFKSAGFKDNSLPAVGLFDVLEHIEDDHDFLEEAARKLRPGGRLYLTVPAYQFLWSDFDVKVGHFRRYNKSSITSVIEASGLHLEYFSYLFSPLPILIWIKRVLGGKKQARQTKNTHYSRSSFPGKTLMTLLSPEYGMIKRKKSIAWGSSCLCVATKR